MATRMTLDLTTPIPVPNIRGVGAEPAGQPDEEGAQWDLWVDIYGPNARLFKRERITVTNTVTTRLSRNAGATGYDDIITKDTVATPTGFTDAMNAYRAGTTQRLRQKGLVDALIAMGALGTGFGGTTS